MGGIKVAVGTSAAGRDCYENSALLQHALGAMSPRK